MAKTIPGKIDASWPRGTYRTECAYCSAARMRHEMRKNESGLLQCTECTGREAVQLDRMNAQHAANQVRTTKPQDSGANPLAANLPVIHRTTASDITRLTS